MTALARHTDAFRVTTPAGARGRPTLGRTPLQGRPQPRRSQISLRRRNQGTQGAS